jgi:protein MAK16
VNEAVWQAVLAKEAGAGLAELEGEEEEEDEDEEELEEEEEGWGDREFVSDVSDEEDLEDLEGAVRICAPPRVRDADTPQDDDDSDEDASEDAGDDEADADGARPPGKGAKPPPPALGKRKAPPPARRPPKKAKRTRISRFYFLTRAALTDADRLPGGPRVEVEYEQEVESVPLTRQALADW